VAAKRLRSLEPPSGSLAPDSAAPHDWDSFDRYNFDVDQHEWLAGLFDALTTELVIVTPSEWAEKQRYLPAQLTPMPGPYRFDVTPYLKEIVDCIGIESPVREVSLMKGVQMAATVGILENGIGYFIEHVKTAPCMFVTADLEIAKLRMDTNITPMITASGMSHLIKSSDALSTRKMGKTDKKLEWFGGGYLLPFGANSANKMRSFSILALFRDEIDAWDANVGKDGDPMKLTSARTDAYELTRKIIDVSTPLVKGTSKIEKRFLAGDQRYYYVCCLDCGHPQVMKWKRTNEKTGEITGITWELEEDGKLVPGSTRYLCEECGHAHTNDDKSRLLSTERGAEWRPTAKPSTPTHRSYHISKLYSPFATWDSCVQDWLEAWNEKESRPRDIEALQVFYNNVLGESFELRGEKLRFEQVSRHRRHEYKFGQVPNEYACQVTGGPILLVTNAVDVHKRNLAVSTMGWTRGGRCFVLDYWRFEGDTEQLDNPDTWGRVRTLVENPHLYTADDGKEYPIALTLVDSGYRSDHVYTFCNDYVTSVIPIKGQDTPSKRAQLKEFNEYQTPLGSPAFHVAVDMYKDRWSAALRRGWDGMSRQPMRQFNAPTDVTDAQLKELTVEAKREKIEQTTGKRVGWEWHRPSGARNEFWDLLIYNNAALDMVAYDVCRRQLDLEFVNWQGFYDLIENEQVYFTGA
jgi:phage terminase large subunit GpA-like protein